MIGCGKLGLACAEMIAEVHNVRGYDINKFESDLIVCCDTLSEAVENADIIFIAVQTPHDPQYDGKAPTSHLPTKDFDYTIVKSVLKDVVETAPESALIVLISTVLPGTTRREFLPIISKRRFAINPYLIAMGTVKWDMVNPEMVMIGTEDGSETGDAKQLVDFYKTIMQNDPNYVVGTWDECECIKVFYNTFISAKVSLVNMVQDVAMRQGNINAELVCDALANADRRIMGPAYMKPGMGDGGACHPRDNIALRHMAERLGLGYDLFGAIMESREVQAHNMAEYLITLSHRELPTPSLKERVKTKVTNWLKRAPKPNPNLVSGRMPIVIVGKSYKPLVPYTDGSSSMLVGHYLAEEEHAAFYHDYNTGDLLPDDVRQVPCVYLLAHDPEVTYGEQLDHVRDFMEHRHVSESDRAFEAVGGMDFIPAPGSILVDPWRKTVTDPALGISVIHYGNTR